MNTSNQKRKVGKLSLEEMDFIKQNCFDMPLQEIADHLNRTIEPVKRFIDKHNLKGRDTTDGEFLLSTLRAKYYYHELKKQFEEHELLFFENQWIDFFKQFNEDVTHTEEMQILEVIRTEILINRSMIDRTLIMKSINDLETLIDQEMSKEMEERDSASLALFQSQMGSLIGAKGSHIHEHEKLLTKKEKYLQQLKGTREQRKRTAEDAKTNFTVWLRELNNLKTRDIHGYNMEVQARAADKAAKELADFHKFQDGEIDRPLLNADTVDHGEEE